MAMTYQPFPWSGAPSAAAMGIWAAPGAAVPIGSGQGFNWASIVGSMYGGPVTAYFPTMRGVPMTTSFVRRYSKGLRGLGQNDGTDLFRTLTMPIPTYNDPSLLPTLGTPVMGNPANAMPTYTVCPDGSLSTTGSCPTTGSSVQSIFAPLISAGANIGQMFASYQNPLLNKSTVSIGPSGILSTNQPSAAAIGATALGSYMPLIVIAVAGLIIVMMLGKK